LKDKGCKCKVEWREEEREKKGGAKNKGLGWRLKKIPMTSTAAIKRKRSKTEIEYSGRNKK